MALSIRTNGTAVVNSPFAGLSADDLGDYVAKELGVTLQVQRNAAQITALTNPRDWLGEYEDRMEALTKKLGKQLQKRTADYAKLYPTDQAIALAQRDISVMYELEKRQLEVEYPGYELLFGQAARQQFANYNAYNPVTKEGAGAPILQAVADDNAIYKRIRREKKAAKRARKAKK